MGQELERLSKATGGRGVGLKNKTNLTQIGAPLQLGKSPGAGTMCSVTLQTSQDPAYNSAELFFYVEQAGRRALFATSTIAPSDNATLQSLEYTVSGFAADYWEIEIQLAGPGLPAVPLFSSITACGVEDIPAGLPITPAALTFSESLTGPGAAGTASFTIPAGTTTYIAVVTMRITASGVDPIGDSISSEAVFAWKFVGGVATLLPLVLNAPNTSYDALMGTATMTPGAAAGKATIAFTTPTGLNAGTVVLVTVDLFPVGDG